MIHTFKITLSLVVLACAAAMAAPTAATAGPAGPHHPEPGVSVSINLGGLLVPLFWEAPPPKPTRQVDSPRHGATPHPVFWKGHWYYPAPDRYRHVHRDRVYHPVRHRPHW